MARWKQKTFTASARDFSGVDLAALRAKFVYQSNYANVLSRAERYFS